MSEFKPFQNDSMFHGVDTTSPTPQLVMPEDSVTLRPAKEEPVVGRLPASVKTLPLRKWLNENFDPTDAERAMSVAWHALMLMESAQRVIECDNAGLRIGRDLAGDLNRHILTLANKMGMYSFTETAEQVEQLRRLLLHKEPTQ